MKLLLIRPIHRWKIWLSKLVAAFAVSAVVVLYCGLCSYVALGAVIGFGSWSTPVGGYYNIAASAGLVTLRTYGLEMASVLSVVCAFMLISTVVETGVAAVGLCAGMTIACSIFVPVMKFVVVLVPSSKWVEYLFFEHWQIAGHVAGGFPFDGWSITGSLVVLGIWAALCVAIGISFFQWKDVKG